MKQMKKLNVDWDETPRSDEAPKSEKVAKTDGGKEIEIYRDPVYAYWRIRFSTGGQLPPVLDGSFTQKNFAEAAISSYLESK